ncbi:MAG TPA: MBL fold metallo-hydrolase [Miltoncostaeaceae bacterium]|nr:MBL fold metallo-hydrolase [Miltoncostaeaceae bacterium]
MGTTVPLQPVDAVEVTVLVDNSVDILLPSGEVAQRPAIDYGMLEGEALIAEHGLSLLLTVERDGDRATVLYDAGLGAGTAIHNMDVLQVGLADLRAVVLSHGHTDHHGGLEGMLRRAGARGLPLVIHPDAWRDRKVVFATGAEIHLPPPSRQDLDREGVAVGEERRPSLLIDGTVLVTGEIERVTEFERGLPGSQALTDAGWEPDPWIRDDQAVVAHVRDRGLVVLSGCSHAGAINVLRQAQRLSGTERIHAFVGGMHLSGPAFEPLIPRTLDELVAIGPAWLVPGHCTGWRATHELARRLPEAYVQTSVGTRLRFS